ncbi:MAG: hypothetical protein R3D26_02345 [Cyanobacteriota/Melainabacteria group bacterium]
MKRTVQRGMDGGLSTERELAQHVDLTNQSPPGQKNLPLGAAPGDQSAQMEALPGVETMVDTRRFNNSSGQAKLNWWQKFLSRLI